MTERMTDAELAERVNPLDVEYERMAARLARYEEIAGRVTDEMIDDLVVRSSVPIEVPAVLRDLKGVRDNAE